MATTLDDTISNAAKAPPPVSFKDGESRAIDLDLLDENPFQPRVKMDAAELEELANSIRTQGLIQYITLRPKSDGRFIIVAGHRRVAAFRKLRDSAGEGDRPRFARIPAQLRLALEDTQLASMAYAENVSRSGLTPVEEGRALEKMLDAGLAKTNEDLAALTSQPLVKIRRLRRIGKAPRFIKDAIDNGCIVAAGKGADGTQVEERRRLELMAALQFIALYEHLQKEKPKQAEERAAGAMRRSLAQNWSLRRTEEFVKGVVEGKRSVESATAEGETAQETTVFERSARRFVVDLSRLAAASDEQVAELRTALEAVIAERSQAKVLAGNHR